VIPVSMELSPQNPPQSLDGEVNAPNAPPLPIDSVEALVKAVQPLLKEYTDFEAGKHQRELDSSLKKFEKEIELATKRLTKKSQERLRVDLGVAVGALAVLIMTGYLFIAGRDASAMELLRFFGTFALGLAGGYGLGKAQKRDSPPATDD
jgi:type VI protein secretion system component VasF